MHIGPNDLVRRRGRAGDGALDLRGFDTLRQGRERLRRVVAGLHFQAFPVDGAAIEPRRRAGFQPPEREAAALQGRGKPDCRRFADPAGRNLLLADMDEAAQERPGGQNHRAGRQNPAIGQANGRYTAFREDQIVGLALDHGQIRRLEDRALHGGGVELAVGLGAGAAHRGAFAAVQNAELDAALVGDAAHQAVQCIDLPHQMALAEPADRRIAGHRADGRKFVRHQRGFGAHPRGRSRGFAAGVAAADDDDVEFSVHWEPQNRLLPEKTPCFT